MAEGLHNRAFTPHDYPSSSLADNGQLTSRKASKDSSVTDVVMDDADVKIGEAWLNPHPTRAKARKPKAVYVMEMEKGAGLSLLASVKEVDMFEELIPPAPLPLRLRNVHSRPSVDVNQRLSRASTTETRQTLDNAYSDLVRTVSA